MKYEIGDFVKLDPIGVFGCIIGPHRIEGAWYMEVTKECVHGWKRDNLPSELRSYVPVASDRYWAFYEHQVTEHISKNAEDDLDEKNFKSLNEILGL
jgi:hypothetical protein